MAIQIATGFLEGIGCPGELKRILQSIATEWGDVVDDVGLLEVIPLKGAMTNEVYQINWPQKIGDCSRKLLFRIYGEGSELFFNRDDEIRTFECMSKHGQGPRLLGRFPDGRVEEFIHARKAIERLRDQMRTHCLLDVQTLSAVDLRDGEISALIAAKMREFHSLDMPGPGDVGLWKRIRDWLSKAKSLCSVKDAKEFRLDIIDDEIRMLEKELSRDCQEIGFCHNDLQYGNIMLDEVTRSMTIIDYEYASHNPVAYDLANHFCEMAADYHSETPHILDYSKYPGLDERRRFVNSYLSSASAEKQANKDEVEKMVADAERYSLANHLLWGLWGIISGYKNNLEFDYIEYARQRFEQYWLKKPALITSAAALHHNNHVDDGYVTYPEVAHAG